MTESDKAVMQQALAALEAMQMETAHRNCGLKITDDSIIALRAAIAQPEQTAKPVAWWVPSAEQFCLQSKDGTRPFAKAWEPLFAESPIAQPELCFMCHGKGWYYAAHAYPPGMTAPETKVKCTQCIAQPTIKESLKVQAIAQPEQPAASITPDTSKVICPACVHQFRAIPQDVQRLMLDAGFEPPFTRAPTIAQPEQQTEMDLAFARALCRSAGISLVSRDFIERFADFVSDWRKGDFELPKLAALDMQSCFDAWQKFDPDLAIAQPQQHTPLTEIDLCLLLVDIYPITKRLPPEFKAFARAIEAAHNIAQPKAKP